MFALGLYNEPLSLRKVPNKFSLKLFFSFLYLSTHHLKTQTKQSYAWEISLHVSSSIWNFNEKMAEKMLSGDFRTEVMKITKSKAKFL